MVFRVADPPVRALSAARAHVVLVDDNKDVLGALAKTLRRMGYLVTETANWRDALDLVISMGADLLVSDMIMPDVDGLELLQLVTRVDPDLPVLLLSGCPSIESAAAAMKLGAIDYLPKPLDMAVFRAGVARGIEIRRERLEKARAFRKGAS